MDSQNHLPDAQTLSRRLSVNKLHTARLPTESALKILRWCLAYANDCCYSGEHFCLFHSSLNPDEEAIMPTVWRSGVACIWFLHDKAVKRLSGTGHDDSEGKCRRQGRSCKAADEGRCYRSQCKMSRLSPFSSNLLPKQNFEDRMRNERHPKSDIYLVPIAPHLDLRECRILSRDEIFLSRLPLLQGCYPCGGPSSV